MKLWVFVERDAVEPGNASLELASLKGHLVVEEPLVEVRVVQHLGAIVYNLKWVWVLPQALREIGWLLHSQV